MAMAAKMRQPQIKRNVFEAEGCDFGLGDGVLSRSEEGEVCGYDHVAFVLDDWFA